MYVIPKMYKVAYAKGLTDYTGAVPEDTATKYDNIQMTLRDKGSMLGRSYTVTFDTNKPTNATSNPSSVASKTGNLASAGTWSYGSSTYGVSSNQTFNPNSQNTTLTFTHNWVATTLNNFTTPTLAGYTFEGWYDAKVGGNKVTSLTINPATTAYEKTLYAHWKAIDYYIDYQEGNTNN